MKLEEKYLFIFKTELNINAEVFAKDMVSAQQKICRLLGITNVNAPIFMTENFDCPKCRCNASECNYDQ